MKTMYEIPKLHEVARILVNSHLLLWTLFYLQTWKCVRKNKVHVVWTFVSDINPSTTGL